MKVPVSMDNDERQSPTQDDINLFVLNELERVNAVLDALIEHSGIPARTVALARLRCEVKQLERERSAALAQANFEATVEIDHKYCEVQRQITALEQQVA